MSKGTNSGGKGSNGGKGGAGGHSKGGGTPKGSQGQVANLPSKTGNQSGPGRGSATPSK